MPSLPVTLIGARETAQPEFKRYYSGGKKTLSHNGEKGGVMAGQDNVKLVKIY